MFLILFLYLTNTWISLVHTIGANIAYHVSVWNRLKLVWTYMIHMTTLRTYMTHAFAQV